jgi:hypothetical protein
VSSIYFDTRNWKFLSEKMNSDYLKTKIRVRWYSDLEKKRHSETSFAEAKFKIGSRREKLRTETAYSGQWLTRVRLDDHRLLTIPTLLREKGVKLPESVYPAFEISYKRLRFLDPLSMCRICFDYDISAPRVNGYMLARSDPFNLYTAVFEVKGSIDCLPQSLKPLIQMGCVKASFSKYAVCYKKIQGGSF